MRSAEFEQLFADIRSGRVNTVMFASLSRLCRSVRDFLHFVEFLDEHGANFISLKEDYDTTSAHGRLMITVMMALNEFEREQTAERTRDAFQARAERGLWERRPAPRLRPRPGTQGLPIRMRPSPRSSITASTPTSTAARLLRRSPP